MDEIGKILPAALKGHIQNPDPRVLEILAPLWPRITGKAIAQHSRPVAFGSGTLTLATDCSTWRAQLHQMSEEIRATINSFLGRRVVQRVRIEPSPRTVLPSAEAEIALLVEGALGRELAPGNGKAH